MNLFVEELNNIIKNSISRYEIPIKIHKYIQLNHHYCDLGDNDQRALPNELWMLILRHITNIGALLAISATCKQLRLLVRKILGDFAHHGKQMQFASTGQQKTIINGNRILNYRPIDKIFNIIFNCEQEYVFISPKVYIESSDHSIIIKMDNIKVKICRCRLRHVLQIDKYVDKKAIWASFDYINKTQKSKYYSANEIYFLISLQMNKNGKFSANEQNLIKYLCMHIYKIGLDDIRCGEMHIKHIGT